MVEVMVKKLISKLLKIQPIFCAVLVAVALVSCDKEEVPTQESEFTPEELAEMAAADKFAAANSVYRALALIDELPDNWESTTYTPAEGVPMDEAHSDIRNVISTGAEQAKQYFLSIVPDLGLEGDTWSHEGVGTLTFRTVNEENCYAVIDVELVQMPGLTQLRFVPEAVVGENTWQGTPYYGVGDVIKDKKKGTYWICVRPSGGPLAKDKAYFVSFDKSLIKTYEQKQDLYEVTKTGKGAVIKTTSTKIEYSAEWQGVKWQYAKNLVEERIALAAAHVFSYLAFAEDFWNSEIEGADYFMNKATALLNCFEPQSLLAEGSNVFYIAYGSYQSSSKKNTQVKYIQPLLSFCLMHNTDGILQQLVMKAWPEKPNADAMVASDNLLSLTDTHDPFTYAYHLSRFGVYNPKPFLITNYALTYVPENPQFPELEDGVTETFMPEYCEENSIPLVMTQMSLKDHGKPASGYELVSPDLGSDYHPDYWGSLENTVRVVFEKGQEGKSNPVTE